MPNSDPTVTFRELTEISDLVVTGELSLQETGQIVTSTSTGSQRVTITAAEADRITFYSGLVAETEAAYIQTMDLGGFPALVVAHPNAVYGSAFRVGTLHVCADAGANGGIHLGHDVSYPAEDNTHDLGTAALSFKDGYFHTIKDEAGVERFDLSTCKGTAYTPALTATTTNPNLGATGTAEGYYYRIGNLINGWVKIEFGGAGAAAGSGVYIISLPVTASANIPTGAGVGCSIGSGRLWDNDGSDSWLIDAQLATNGTLRLRYDMQTAVGNVTNALPFTWATADYMTVCFSYEAA